MKSDTVIPEKYKLNQFFSHILPRILFVVAAVAIIGIVLVLLANQGKGGSTATNSLGEASPHGPLAKFFFSYLFSYIFYMGIFFGAMFFVLLQFITASGWSVLIRRVAETFLKNIWLMIPLAIPIFFGLHDLYHWTHPEAVAEDKILQAKSAYLNITFFIIRLVIYFIVLFLIANFYYKNSVKQDRTPDQAITLKLQRYSSVSILLFALVISFFAIDLVMSLEPHWFSTIWGIYYFTGSFVLLLSFMTLLTIVFKFFGKFKEVNAEHFHDLGKYLFTFNVFWSYIAFSQYMLIWYANIPEGTLFFINRINGSWRTVSYLLVLGHVVFPILALVSRNVKRNTKLMFFMSLWIIFIQMVDFYWLVMPNIDTTGIQVDLTDILVFVGMGSLFFGWFFLNLGRNAIVPYNDPRLNESIHFKNI